ncbi:CaiF/GrlA family transcriptional regulator [Kalamiella sp. sgz302252]|uniref:CaiF/GrlA family transcriptional regulator n=1 Tax=Pantoea sp. sgz302252 TaxID=3341827 RepID=UPI0036D313ED
MNLHHVGKQPLLRKAVKQRNHDGANVPPSLQEYADQPLYVLIAMWCMQQNDWVDREQISDAFAITERRASFQISYILRHAERIQCLTRKVKTEQTGRYRQQLKVQRVCVEESVPKAEPAVRQSNLKTAVYPERQESWRWVLTRQAPGMK